MLLPPGFFEPLQVIVQELGRSRNLTFFAGVWDACSGFKAPIRRPPHQEAPRYAMLGPMLQSDQRRCVLTPHIHRRRGNPEINFHPSGMLPKRYQFSCLVWFGVHAQFAMQHPPTCLRRVWGTLGNGNRSLSANLTERTNLGGTTASGGWSVRQGSAETESSMGCRIATASEHAGETVRIGTARTV